jgi:hypothetical protein
VIPNPIHTIPQLDLPFTEMRFHSLYANVRERINRRILDQIVSRIGSHILPGVNGKIFIEFTPKQLEQAYDDL